MTKEKYQGWTNYETWTVNLLMRNDQESSKFWDKIAEDALTDADKDSVCSKEERATINLSDTMKEHFEDKVPDLTGHEEAEVYDCLIRGALSKVNWDEISGHLIEDAMETVPA